MKELLQENGWLGVAFILTLQFVYTVWKDKNRDKDELLKRLVESSEKVELKLSVIEKDANLIPKMKLDLDRSYAVLRYIGGDKYAEAQKFLGESHIK